VGFGHAEKSEHIRILQRWMNSYGPQELFDQHGKLAAELAELAELAPLSQRRMGDNPHVNGGLLLRSRGRDTPVDNA
jgi:xylulose-5-phosphate/fructose-6-phosphate phosphoketolase